jgi:hypothetical protein
LKVRGPKVQFSLLFIPLEINDDNFAEEEVKERAKRAAAAARKWREYSRKKGAAPTVKLPEATSSTKDN